MSNAREADTEPRVHYAADPPRTTDVVVVGGGIVGAATAFFAVRAGLRVAVLERRPRLATLTTPVSTGAFRLQFDNRPELELVREGVELFGDFAERTGLAGWDLRLRLGGYLFASLSVGSWERAQRLVERQHAWGLGDVELLSGDEARARFPYLSGDVLGARFRARDGWLDPLRLALGYATAASSPETIPGRAGRGGAVFCTSTEVAGLLRSGETITGVRTTRGSVSAPAVVLAAGPFLGRLAAFAGLRVEVRPTRRQKLILPELPEVPPEAPMTIDDDTGAHWRPALRGALALFTEQGTPPSEPLDEVPVSTGWAFDLLDPASTHSLARVAPFWRRVWERGSDAWLLQAGQYEYTPDHLPYLGPTPVPGLHLNGGYSGHGIMASTGGSRTVVDLLTGADDASTNPFRLDRPPAVREHDVL